MSDIKTGNKGFVNPIDGKVYHIDQVPVGEDGVNIPDNLKPVDPGNIKIDSTVKDIGKKTRLTLGTYLSELTKGNVGSTSVSNKYTIDPPTDATQTSTIVDEKGYPSPISPSQNSKQFNKGLPSSFSNEFSKLQQGGEKIKKGLSSVDAPDGNTLLPDAKKQGSPIPEYTSSVVSNNVFNSEVNTYLDPEIDPTAPPASFEPEINDIAGGEAKGVYSGADKDPLTLKESRQKAVDATEKNRFSLDKTSADKPLSSTTDPVTGVPSQLSGQSNENSYVPGIDIKPQSSDPSLVGTGFSKGKNVKVEYDGHNLLKTVSGNTNTTTNNLAKKSSGVGGATDDEFGVPVNNGKNVPSGHPISSYKTGGLGVLSAGNNRWAPKVTSDPGFNPSLKVVGQSEPVSHLKMAKVGTGLLQRASAEIPAFTADRFDPTSNTAELGAILPSAAQLGILKVNNQLLSAKDVLNSLEDSEVDTASLSSIAPFGGQSWGNLTSPSEPFDDPSSIGLSVTMLLMVNAITLLLDSIAPPGNGDRPIKTEKGRRVKGKSTFKAENNSFAFDVWKFFGIYQTRNNFRRAVSVGSKAFFLGGKNAGITNGDLALATLGAGLDSIIGDGSAVGANLSVCRTIIRSGLIIADYFSSIYKRGVESFTGGAKASLGLVKIVRSSKLVRALNVFAMLGDNVIEASRGPALTNPDGSFEKFSGPDSIDPNFFDIDKGNKKIKGIKGSQTSIKKSRLTYGDNYDPTLAWSSARSPSIYLTNPGITAIVAQDSEGNLGSFKGSALLSNKSNGGTPHAIFHKTAESGTSRISNDDREVFERILDAEYVPFSFHDVRTNEVISFHAFLASLTDDYTVAYDTTEGFGRIEPVKTYKGTIRRIGMSFYVAATSEQDFDHMWFKINKLSTMVYPQYTSGRDLLPGNYSFKAPFSQLPAASPLIRIRLGDLIRSNYSRFALARLFGAADGTMKLPNSDAVNFDSEQTKRVNKLAKSFQESTNPIFVGKSLDKFAFNDKFQHNSFFDLYLEDELSDDLIISLKETGVVNSVKIKQISSEDSEEYIVDCNVSFNRVQIETTSIIEEFLSDVSKKYFSNLNLTFSIPPDNPIFYQLYQFQAGLQLGIDIKSAGEFAALDSFMQPENNAIVKSFESAAGRGLAGVIETMNFDWYDKVTWSTDFGRTAPKMCKVTISFSPIHDISPGIDHLGYNRAPIYPVGAGSAPSITKKPVPDEI